MSTSESRWEDLAVACAEEGVASACPSWCYGDHQQAIEEGCGLPSLYEHVGAEQGAVSWARHHPSTGTVVHEGGHHWRIWAESVQAPNSGNHFLTAPRLYLEIGVVGDRHTKIELDVGGVRELGRALERLADQVQFDELSVLTA